MSAPNAALLCLTGHKSTSVTFPPARPVISLHELGKGSTTVVLVPKGCGAGSEERQGVGEGGGVGNKNGDMRFHPASS